MEGWNKILVTVIVKRDNVFQVNKLVKFKLDSKSLRNAILTQVET